MEQFIDNFIAVYLPLLLAIWPVLSLIAALTPTEYDNQVLQVLRKVLDAIAFNFGKAKNAKDVKDDIPSLARKVPPRPKEPR